MRKIENDRHIVDILFVITLFGIFTICALLIVILGSHIYQKTISDMNNNFSSRTSYTYFSEKLRQSPKNQIFIEQIDGKDVLRIEQIFNDTTYNTYLYEDEGYLKECFIRAENGFSRDFGDQVLPISELTIEKIENNLLHIMFLDESSNPVSLYIQISC